MTLVVALLIVAVVVEGFFIKALGDELFESNRLRLDAQFRLEQRIIRLEREKDLAK